MRICRYATTLVTSNVKNPESRSREIFLTVILPDTAFISRFAIELDGKFFFGKVQKKEDAWLEYQEAVGEGRTAGTSINMISKFISTFDLTTFSFLKTFKSKTKLNNFNYIIMHIST